MDRTPILHLDQSWIPADKKAFLPGTVRVGWRDEKLFVLAELTDADIFSDATQINQKTWELGDVLEIFLKSLDVSDYVEFHVTPNNQRLQLRFPDTAALREAQRTGCFEPFLITSADALESRVWVNDGRWTVLASIPAVTVWGERKTMAGAAWRFSFSRYDYTRGAGKPVLSSTSPHPEPDFHSQSEWGVLRFHP